MTTVKARIPTAFIVGVMNSEKDHKFSSKGRTAIMTEINTSGVPATDSLKLKTMPDSMLAKVLVDCWSIDFVERAFKCKWTGAPILRKRFK